MTFVGCCRTMTYDVLVAVLFHDVKHSKVTPEIKLLIYLGIERVVCAKF
jgi:hypothetical protein